LSSQPDRTGGYIAVYRKLLDHPLTTQLPAAWFRIFIVILLRVNWRPGVWWNGSQNIEIPPGSLVTSVDKLSKMARASTKQVRGCLGYLQTARIAAIKTASQYTTITIVNWSTYQNVDERDGKPNGEVKGEQRASQGQTEGKAGATIKEVNHGIIQEGEKTPSDDSRASHKNRAKAQECSGDGPQKPPAKSEPKKPTHTAADREMLRTVMAKHLSRVIGPMGLLEPPDDGDLDRVLAALDSCPVDKFCAHLQSMPAKYQGNGRNAPRGWAWFAIVAGNYAGAQPLQTPTVDRCRHGKPYGVCVGCNHPDEDDARSDSFSTLDHIEGAA
jgi:hypothetical protein